MGSGCSSTTATAGSRRGIAVIGSGGALVLARQLGLVSRVRSLLDDLMMQGLRLSPAVHSRILTDAGEAP